MDEVGAAEWAALTARAPASLAGSREWCQAACATVDRGAALQLLTVRAAGRLVGLLPLVCDGGPRPVVRFAGSPFNDLNDLQALPGYESIAAAAAVDALFAHAAQGTEVVLDDLDPMGVLATAGAARLPSWEAASSAPTIDLLDPSARPSDRRRRAGDRALQGLRRTHHVEFRQREGAAEMAAAYGAFAAVRDARLRALRRNLSDPPAAMLAAVLRRLAPAGRCVFMEMTIDGEAVARDLYLVEGGVAMLWLRALDMGWLRHSCGHLLLRAAVEAFAAAGFTTLDLGRGAEPYKFACGARERVLLRVRIPASAGSGTAALVLRHREPEHAVQCTD